VLGSAAAAALAGRGLFAQGRGGAAPIAVNRLSDSFAMLTGAGGNVSLVVGPEGLLMIDGGVPQRAEALVAAVAGVDRRRVLVLFNTHYHFDHVGSNELLGRAPGPPKVRIIAHENVKKRLSERMQNEAFGMTFEPLAPEGLPTETFMSSGRLQWGDNRLDYSHVPPSHTDGDAFLFMEGENVLITGDLFWMGRYPVIDYSAGGSLAAMVTALDTMDRSINDSTRIVPGHGPIATRADMRALRDTWGQINLAIETMVQQGRTVEEVIAAAPTKDWDAQLGTASREGFIRQAYGGIRARRP
jgi:glyoxylase-like metal-dependent hydrolase (beta-lactamase superfamily II)